MMIIGIAGPKRAGKDTAANALVRDLGFQRRAFADKLKDLAMTANPLVTSNVQTVNISTGAGHLAHVVKGNGGWEPAKDYYPLVREFLQNLGEGARQVFGEMFWIEQCLADFDPDSDDKIVISDVRYENEVDAIQSLGGRVVRLDRIGFRGQGHRSETEIGAMPKAAFDAVIENDGSVLELERDTVETVKAWVEAEEPKSEPDA